MSIIRAPDNNKEDWGAALAEFHFVYSPLEDTNAAEGCFVCGDRMEYPVIQWHGSGDIFMHPDCAEYLGNSLIKDARAAKGSNHGGN